MFLSPGKEGEGQQRQTGEGGLSNFHSQKGNSDSANGAPNSLNAFYSNLYAILNAIISQALL